MGVLKTQFVETPNGGDVLLQAVPTTQQTADALALVTAVGAGSLVKDTDPRLVRLDAAELIATRLSMAAGDLTVGVASDSTANDGNDWVPLWAQMVAARHTGLRVEHIGWDTTAQAWKAPWVIQAGNGTGPTGGTVLRDTFTRTGEIIGSTTDDGKTWGGSPTGVWSADGSSAGASAFSSLTRDCGARDVTMTVKLRLVTTQTGAAQNLRFNLGGGVFAALSLSSVGAPSVTVFKGGSTVIVAAKALATELGTAVNSATVQEVTLSLQVALQNITLTLAQGATTKTYTAQITEAEYGSLTNVAMIQSQGAIPGIRLDEVTLAVPATSGSSQTLRILNGAVGGATLQYQVDRVGAMWPAGTPVHVVIMAGGHNYGTQGETAFTGALDAFVTALRTVQPGALLLVSSENPQFAPSTTAQAHKLRQAAARLWARRNGHAYVAALEAFLAQPDGGQSLVGSDGIHPTTPTGTAPTEGTGSTLWAHVIDDLIHARY